MLSERILRNALERIGADAPVRFDEVTGSTNATALEMAESGAPEWTLVAAGHQTAGRGRLGRTWVDEPGGALLLSIVLRPELPPERGGLLALLAGASMAAACRDVAGAPAGCKWPNDLMIGGEKAGGVLAESRVVDGRIEHVVLGIGVNLAGPPPGLRDAGGLGGADDEALLSSFLGRFRARYEPVHPAFPGAVLSAYREVSTTLGARVRATTVDGRAVEGRATDVDEHGGLILETTSGRAVVAFGEVRHLEG